ncbi:RNA exonuclease Rex2 [Xylona heveae TC161]|uniref:RNA exonuclease Rex2 n=1 Tax=Xylona heveae (strain CBS 132557 / TC161) TaxID=1328760 RepID=A0A165GRH6_XYLHT|nr:RNA exonuclease Rex2 [Xylona heveae TC161]KZF22503.1 RNA exonuclease Rex2 [Xylona heveae TC161]
MMSTTRSEDPLVWIDCEMTGLDYEKDSILQISCFITDAQLRLLDEEGYGAIIHHDKAVLDSMNEWCIKTHGATGLTAAVLTSTTTAEQAAIELLAYVKKYVPQPRKAMLAGNSVHADKAFLCKAPYNAVLDHLHYRILDVSSLKEAARRWAPAPVLNEIPQKRGIHEARQDILESIEEARFYQEAFFSG